VRLLPSKNFISNLGNWHYTSKIWKIIEALVCVAYFILIKTENLEMKKKLKYFLRSGLGMQDQNWRVPACPVSRQNAS
jgi:hypothetical protein